MGAVVHVDVDEGTKSEKEDETAADGQSSYEAIPCKSSIGFTSSINQISPSRITLFSLFIMSRLPSSEDKEESKKGPLQGNIAVVVNIRPTRERSLHSRERRRGKKKSG